METEQMHECWNVEAKMPYCVMQTYMTPSQAEQRNKILEARRSELRWRLKAKQPKIKL